MQKNVNERVGEIVREGLKNVEGIQMRPYGGQFEVTERAESEVDLVERRAVVVGRYSLHVRGQVRPANQKCVEKRS